MSIEWLMSGIRVVFGWNDGRQEAEAEETQRFEGRERDGERAGGIAVGGMTLV